MVLGDRPAAPDGCVDDEHSNWPTGLDDAYASLLPEVPEASDEGEDNGHVPKGAR